MKYCSKCGNELLDEAVICPNCGCETGYQTKKSQNDILRTVAKIFMLISCIVSAIALIPLVWTIPMTVHYWRKVGNNESVGVGFKVCSLLFVNTIAGILMLCDN